MEPVVLRTLRLELSVLTEGDAEALFAAGQDPAVQRYTSVPTPFTRADADELIAATRAGWQTGDRLSWAVREQGMLVGIVGLYRVDGKGSGELGYWLAAPARGRGLLTEAARTALDWGFSADGAALARIEWHAVVGNTASARVAERLGFRFEGVRRAALIGSDGREDGWSAALLATDDRTPQTWPIP